MSTAILDVLATQRVEGIQVDAQTIELMKLMDDGHVSVSDAIQVVLMAADKEV